MAERAITITCADGVSLAATLVPAAKSDPVLVIAPAMGVPQRFYADFASYLAAHAITVVTFDYRGFAASRHPDIDSRKIEMADWGRLDIDAALRWTREELDPQRLFLLGHSCGGQLVGLAPHSSELAGIVLVAAQSAYWRHWPLPRRLAMLLWWYVIVPGLGFGHAEFPARLAGLGSSNLPRGVTAQWARWAKTPGYLFNEKHGIDTQRYATLSIPLLAYGFDDDHYAPPAAVDALLQHYPNVQLTRRQIAPASLQMRKIGHFGFFRDRMRDTLWREIRQWLETVE